MTMRQTFNSTVSRNGECTLPVVEPFTAAARGYLSIIYASAMPIMELHVAQHSVGSNFHESHAF